MEPLIYKKTLEIEMLDTCNLKCETCARLDFPQSKIHLKPEQIYSIVKDNKYERIQFMGSRSEPTLHPKFLEIITWLLDNNIEIELYTNGVTRNRKWWTLFNEALSINNRANNLIINWGLAGNNEELHKIYRQSSLSKLIENVKIMTNAINLGLYIMFDYNTKGYLNPIDTTGMISINKPFNNLFVGVLYIHSGDWYLKDHLKSQSIQKYIIKDYDDSYYTHCMGDGINFYSMDQNLYKCKYQYEALSSEERLLQPTKVNINICKENCNIDLLPKIRDKFISNNKYEFERRFNESRVFNIEYLRGLRGLNETKNN